MENSITLEEIDELSKIAEWELGDAMLPNNPLQDHTNTDIFYGMK